MLDGNVIAAYLKRLGMPGQEPASLDYLFELHKAHVERLSWQTIDIVAGKPASIDVKQSVELLISGRSGYCFHLNGAFSELLRSLGYRVYWHRAGVQRLDIEPNINGFHLGLTVELPEENRGQRWIVDVGLGDIPFEPIPLRQGVYAQGPLQYKVTPSTVDPNGWRLEHDPEATFVGVDFAAGDLRSLDEFLPKHEVYSRSPDSPWIRLLLVRQRHASGSNELRGCIWRMRDANGIKKEELDTQSRWLEVLGDVFHEHLVDYAKVERGELWKQVRQTHEEWLRTQNNAAR